MTRDIFYICILHIFNNHKHKNVLYIFLKICEPCKNFPTIFYNCIPSECRIIKSQCQNRKIENLRLFASKILILKILIDSQQHTIDLLI